MTGAALDTSIRPEASVDVNTLLLNIVSEICGPSPSTLHRSTAEHAIKPIEALREQAVLSKDPLTQAEKMFLVRIGELVNLLRGYAFYSRGQQPSELAIRTLAEDCIILRK